MGLGAMPGGGYQTAPRSGAQELQRVAQQLVEAPFAALLPQAVRRGARLRRLVAQADESPRELIEGIATRPGGGARGRHLRQGEELLLQLDHEPLRGLLADARHLGQAPDIALGHRPRQLARLDAGEDVLRRTRPDVLHPDELVEDLLLLLGREAEQLERVLAHVGVGAERGLLAGRRECRERRGGELHPVADAIHVEDRVIAALLDDDPAQASDHAPSAKRRTEGRSRRSTSARVGGAGPRRTGCADPRARWQTATASASASSASFAWTPKIARAVRTICAFSARPLPVKARFTSLGAYSKIGSPACAAAASATPRACPSASAERGERPQNAVSTATAASPAVATRWVRPRTMMPSRSAIGRSPGTSTPDATRLKPPPAR